MSEPAVEVEGLTRTFGDFVAVDDLSFDVGRAEVFGFLGANGAGKTTTIKMLAGLLAPSAGRGRVAGFDVATEPESIKQNIGYMSQLFSLYTDLTVEENIDLFAGLYGVPRSELAERRAWVLGMARLDHQRRRRVGELPLGWKQRLALGCAVLHRPAVLFLDEPTSGVDPVSRRSFWELIYNLAGDGATVFVTTHYMQEAEHCHRLALMNRGRLIALDTPAALRRDLTAPLLEVRTPQAPRAARLLADEPWVEAAGVYGRTVHLVAAAAAGDGDAAAQRATERTRSRLAEAGVAVEGIARIEPSLEDVFVALVTASGGAREE